MIESWGSIADYISKATGRDVSAEAARKLSERDIELRQHITYLNKKPGIDRHHLDRWILIAIHGKRPRRKPIRAVIEWCQLMLGGMF